MTIPASHPWEVPARRVSRSSFQIAHPSWISCTKPRMCHTPCKAPALQDSLLGPSDRSAGLACKILQLVGSPTLHPSCQVLAGRYVDSTDVGGKITTAAGGKDKIARCSAAGAQQVQLDNLEPKTTKQVAACSQPVRIHRRRLLLQCWAVIVCSTVACKK